MTLVRAVAIVKLLAGLFCASAAMTVLAGCSDTAEAHADHPTQAIVRSNAEQARWARDFVDTIGINIHLSYHDGPYGRFPAIAALLHGLGVRHLRDGVVMGQNDVCRSDRALAADGMRIDFLTQANLTADNLVTWAGCVGPAIEAYEGLNEYDISHGSDPDWVATVQNAQRALYRNVKAQPQLAGLTVIGPSFTSEGAYRTVGDLSAALDQGNMHDYFAGHEPGTGGWGLGGYGSIMYNMQAAQHVAGAKPIDSTETGYLTGAGDQRVDLQTQAKYVPRMFFEHFNAGVPRTYQYELVDEGGPPFDTFGLARGDFSRKPAYAALASTIALLRDSARGATPDRLAYTLDAAPPALRHTLLEKHDGRFLLALWIEEAGFDPKAHVALRVPATRVLVNVAQPIAHASIYAFDDGETLRRTAVDSNRAIPVGVSDRVTFLELVPVKRR